MAAWQHPPWQDDSITERGESRQSVLRYKVHWHAAVRGCEACILCAMRAMCAQYGGMGKVSGSHYKASAAPYFLSPSPLSPASTDSGPLANPAAAQAIPLVSSSVVRLVIRCVPPGQPGLAPVSTDKFSPTRSFQKYLFALTLRERYMVGQVGGRGPFHTATADECQLLSACSFLLLRRFSLRLFVVLC